MTAKLKARTKTMWLKALRSGNYKQERHELKTPNGHCCLGVLLEEAVKVRPIPFVTVEEDQIRCGISTGIIPNEIWEQFFVKEKPKKEVAFVKVSEKAIMKDKLVTMNDQGTGFAEIANWIEANL